MGPAELYPHHPSCLRTDIRFSEKSCHSALFWNSRRWPKPIGQEVLQQSVRELAESCLHSTSYASEIVPVCLRRRLVVHPASSHVTFIQYPLLNSRNVLKLARRPDSLKSPRHLSRAGGGLTIDVSETWRQAAASWRHTHMSICVWEWNVRLWFEIQRWSGMGTHFIEDNITRISSRLELRWQDAWLMLSWLDYGAI
jgi:hypothetical protein